MEMRRKELEITAVEEIDEVILDCDCMRLALPNGDYPYIVPLNFGYVRKDGTAKFYIHSANAGTKVELCRKMKRGSFELDTKLQLKTGDVACNYSMIYRSVVGQCDITELTAIEEKDEALKVIMSHYSDRTDWTFSPASLEKTCVFCLTVKEMRGKKHD